MAPQFDLALESIQFEGSITSTAYSASKGGIVGATLPLARELGVLSIYPFTRIKLKCAYPAEHGIRVNNIAPGPFATAMTAVLPEAAQASFNRELFFPKRFGTGFEFAQAVRFLIECTYVNGETLTLNGAMRLPTKVDI